MNMWILS
jgi:Predicted Zn-dependent peptidases